MTPEQTKRLDEIREHNELSLIGNLDTNKIAAAQVWRNHSEDMAVVLSILDAETARAGAAEKSEKLMKDRMVELELRKNDWKDAWRKAERERDAARRALTKA